MFVFDYGQQDVLAGNRSEIFTSPADTFPSLMNKTTDDRILYEILPNFYKPIFILA